MNSHQDAHSNLSYQDWGLIDYQEALNKQIHLAQKVFTENLPGYIVFCSHPAVVTIGSATQTSDITDWKGPLIEISRGGRATYHGPSQLMIYVIVNLQIPRKDRKQQEVGGLLRAIEKSLVETLATYEIQAQGKKDDETGVWINDKKIASLGIAVKNWVSLHGAAINLDYDSTAFQGIKPCGFSPHVMVSLEQILKNKIDRNEFISRLKIQLDTNI